MHDDDAAYGWKSSSGKTHYYGGSAGAGPAAEQDLEMSVQRNFTDYAGEILVGGAHSHTTPPLVPRNGPPGLTPRSSGRVGPAAKTPPLAGLTNGIQVSPRLSDPGSKQSTPVLVPQNKGARKSDPGASWASEKRRGGHGEEGLHGFTLTALEMGLQLDIEKDESTKDSTFVWQSGASLRRGFTVLLMILVLVVVLMVASRLLGWWWW